MLFTGAPCVDEVGCELSDEHMVGFRLVAIYGGYVLVLLFHELGPFSLELVLSFHLLHLEFLSAQLVLYHPVLSRLHHTHLLHFTLLKVFLALLFKLTVLFSKPLLLESEL